MEWKSCILGKTITCIISYNRQSEKKYLLLPGKSYPAPAQDLPRDMEFQVEKQSPKEVTMLLRSNDETKTNYPFDFEFRIRYKVQGDELSTEYLVTNTGSGMLIFSVGGHPAFRLPLTADTKFEDYYLKFEETKIFPAGLYLVKASFKWNPFLFWKIPIASNLKNHFFIRTPWSLNIRHHLKFL